MQVPALTTVSPGCTGSLVSEPWPAGLLTRYRRYRPVRDRLWGEIVRQFVMNLCTCTWYM